MARRDGSLTVGRARPRPHDRRGCGAWFRRVEITRAFTAEELDALPPLHAARKDPGLQVVRHDIQQLDMPPFGRVKNRVGVIFHGEMPTTASHPA